MYSTEDTIVAIATPPGRGGIGVVRISGPGAQAAAVTLSGRAGFEPRYATLAEIRSAAGFPIDQAIVTSFPSPHSYTGEDVVEISAHGSPVILEAIVGAAIDAGARLANPGEFTLRAYLHGRIDLVQAEAVADLVDAVTPLQVRAAFDQLQGTLTTRIKTIDQALMDVIVRLEASLDFPDEGYHFITPPEAAAAIASVKEQIDALLVEASRGRLIREGLTVAILGRPNVGKSSLFNRLAGAARAIVSDRPGTTRDLVTERVDLGGVPVTLVDTAGVRDDPADGVEEEGIGRARGAAAAADLVLVLLDSSRPLDADDHALLDATAHRQRIVVAAKGDLAPAWGAEEAGALRVSALTDLGIDSLRVAMQGRTEPEPLRDVPSIANARHRELLVRARSAVVQAMSGVAMRAAEEFVLEDLHEARRAFDEIAGTRSPDTVLQAIFDRFCIGK